jgi:RNA polymerase sigma factor (sigma-70 family)
MLYPVPTADEELLQRWREGDAAAGNELFLRYFRSIRRFFANKVPAEEVEDLVQRTFTACVEARDRVRAESGLRSFLFGVARRQLLKFLRERASLARRVDVDFGVSSVRDLGHTPSSMLARQQDHELVLQGLQRVSVEHQTMLELFYWEQLPGPEIAEILGIAPATVRTRLFRGRQALEQALRELAGGELGPSPDVEAALRKVGSAQ